MQVWTLRRISKNWQVRSRRRARAWASLSSHLLIHPRAICSQPGGSGLPSPTKTPKPLPSSCWRNSLSSRFLGGDNTREGESTRDLLPIKSADTSLSCGLRLETQRRPMTSLSSLDHSSAGKTSTWETEFLVGFTSLSKRFMTGQEEPNETGLGELWAGLREGQQNTGISWGHLLPTKLPRRFFYILRERSEKDNSECPKQVLTWVSEHILSHPYLTLQILSMLLCKNCGKCSLYLLRPLFFLIFKHYSTWCISKSKT